MTERSLKYASFVAALGAGMAVGVLSGRRRRVGANDAALQSLKQSLADLEHRMTSQQQAMEVRIREIDARLEEHSAKLAEIPSTTQIVDAIEQLLTKSMASLDQRLTAQASNIEVLRTKVSQTDKFLERFLAGGGVSTPPLPASRASGRS